METSSRHLERQEIIKFPMIKADDYFVTWLDVGYVLIIVMPKNPLYIRMSSVVYMYR